MTKHTPGPWQHDYNRIEGRFTVCQFHPDPEKWPSPADARLIAATPDLLAALDELTEAVGRYVNNVEDWPEITKARAAIAKALGKD